jgi:hypothetical protein
MKYIRVVALSLLSGLMLVFLYVSTVTARDTSSGA